MIVSILLSCSTSEDLNLRCLFPSPRLERVSSLHGLFGRSSPKGFYGYVYEHSKLSSKKTRLVVIALLTLKFSTSPLSKGSFPRS